MIGWEGDRGRMIVRITEKPRTRKKRRDLFEKSEGIRKSMMLKLVLPRHVTELSGTRTGLGEELLQRTFNLIGWPNCDQAEMIPRPSGFSGRIYFMRHGIEKDREFQTG